jgi:hypothetical protein
MAEDVVEDVGLLQVVELVGPADELAGREAPVRQVVEEDLVGHQAGHGHHLPAGGLHQHLAEGLEIGDAVGAMGRASRPLRKASQARPGSSRHWRSNRVAQVACSAGV